MNRVQAAFVRINLGALKRNYKLAQSLAAGSKTMAVIKADAYGHGVLQAAIALKEIAEGIAVANVTEGIQLRQNGVLKTPLLILQGFNNLYSMEEAVAHNLQVVVQCKEQVDLVLTNKWPSTIPVWVKWDTGMHRLGLADSHGKSMLKEVQAKFGDNMVLCSHYACSDDENMDYSNYQLNLLKEIISSHRIKQWSMANSGGILAIPESHGTWNRAGFMLYGNSPLAYPNTNADKLQPVMEFFAPVIATRWIDAGVGVGYSLRWKAPRRSKIATLAVGYADGYPRHARNGTPVLINGHRAKLVGGVCMDMIMVDVTEFENQVNVGDMACLWGDTLPVNEVAQHSGTIGYELLTRVMPRVKRHFYEN